MSATLNGTILSTNTPTDNPRATVTQRTPYTPTITLPVFMPSFIGTSVPDVIEPIGVNNFQRLTQVAQWGRGTILASAFSPDNQQIIVGSAFGLASYNRQDLEQVPDWMPFEEPILYHAITFSQDSHYLLLQDIDKVFDLHERRFISEPAGIDWAPAPIWSTYGGAIEADSPNGKWHISVPDEGMGEYHTVVPILTVSDKTTGKILYTISDKTLYLAYHDFRLPEGCDLRDSSPYETPYGTYWPNLISFSPSDDTLTILYKTPWYGISTDAFSIIRIYNTDTGSLIEQIGSQNKPIATFAYKPDGSGLIIGYGEGSVQLWDIRHNQATFGAWYFSNNIEYAEFTSDSQYFVLQSQGQLEIRSTLNGSLMSRFDAVAYALSPANGNVVAIADPMNVIKILEIDTGHVLQTIRGHSDRILALTFSPDGLTLVSSSQDCQIKLWNSQTGEFVHYFEETTVNPNSRGPAELNPDPMSPNSRIFINYIKFIPGTNQVIGLSTAWDVVVSWDITSGETKYVIYDPHWDGQVRWYHNPFYLLGTFSTDVGNNRLFLGNGEFNLQTGEYISEDETSHSCENWGPLTADRRLQFTQEAAKSSWLICVLDSQDLHMVYPITVMEMPNEFFSISGLVLSPDGTRLLVTNTMGTVFIYQIIR
jgi:WD40 repeat protein